MSMIPSSYDQLFQSAITDLQIARDFFKHYLPHPAYESIESLVDQLKQLENSPESIAYIKFLLDYTLANGIERGLEQGVALGMRLGGATLLLHLLERKFPNIPLMYRQQIEQATTDQLMYWSTRIFDIHQISDLFDYF